MELRDYQRECYDKIENHFRTNNRQLIQLPTGAGKTIIFLEYLRNHSNKSLIVCPTIDLKEQIYANACTILGKSNCYLGVPQNNRTTKHCIVVAASLNSYFSQAKIFSEEFDTIIIDEAHRAQCKTYTEFLRLYRKVNSNFKLLGCTATPERMDRKPLLEIFGEMTFSMTLVDLINQNQLCDIEAYRIKTQETIDNKKCRRGDLTQNLLRNLDTDSRNKLLYQTYFENCLKKKTLIFCLSIEHSDAVAAHFKAQGIAAESIHGKVHHTTRKQILERFKQGKTMVLTNCQLLTEGFDEPSIEALIIARPTKSKTLYCQMIGRGVRKFPGKDVCSLYELTDNCFNICTFNVAANKEPDFQRDYRPGIRLTDLATEIEEITLSEIILNKEKIDLLQNKIENPAFDHQILKLQKKNINFFAPISFEEAAFLLWKDKLWHTYVKEKGSTALLSEKKTST